MAPVGAGTVDVRVVMPDGTTSASNGDRFTYVPTGQLPITAQGQHLEIGGVPTVFTGYNAYQLATDWGTNAGCGGMASTAQIDAFFASLRPDSLVRFWAFQGTMATNVHTGQIDWAPLDNVFYAAAKYHVYLIPVISDQAGTCDGGHWQDPAWYSGGFRDVYNSAADSDGQRPDPALLLGLHERPREPVRRLARTRHVGADERGRGVDMSGGVRAEQLLRDTRPVPTRPAAASALKYFFTTVGGADPPPRPRAPRRGGLPRWWAVRHGLAATTRVWGHPRASTS